MSWLYVAHLGTMQEAISQVRNLTSNTDVLIAATGNHDFLQTEANGRGPVGGVLVALELPKQEAEKIGKSLTPLGGDHQEIWKWAVFKKAPGAASWNE